jgi:TRAP transporter 4TM/12TM fusion protein
MTMDEGSQDQGIKDGNPAGIEDESFEAGVEEAKRIAEEEEAGYRHLVGWDKWIIPTIAVIWCIFQLSVASWLLIDTIIIRAIHLGFAMLVAFLSYPALKKPRKGFFSFLSARRKIPAFDYVMAALGCLSAIYIWLDYTGIAGRQGAPITRDMVIGITLVLILLEASRRVIGPALTVIAGAFSLYVFYAESMPEFMAFKNVSVSKYIGKIAMQTEGIYGIPLDVSATIVFLFVLFGTMLDRAGGGRFFIELALSLLGRFKGGPAKAAIVGSGLTGLVSGSSIANIVTTGTFTIPLMKKVGYKPTKAAAIEVAASTDGQLAPPIMGAAAFIIAEYLSVPYLDVIKAAAIPAFVSYATLLFIAHVEASKAGLRGLTREETPDFLRVLKGGLHFLLPIGVLVYELVVPRHSPELSVFRAIIFMFFIMLLAPIIRGFIALRPEGERPITSSFFKRFFYIILVYTATYVYFLMVRESSLEHAFYNSFVVLNVSVLAWEPLRNKLRKEPVSSEFKGSFTTIIQSMAAGGRNMVTVAVATAAAGIIVGVVTMGIGGIITEVVEFLSMGNIFLLVIITAVASLLLGMGLPTTATYIVMAALTAPIIVKVGGAQGFIVPLMAAHLFCFYFGILADDTPPVGLAAYAAAAIAKSPPIPTGIQGFMYDIRTAMIAIMFIFNHDLILHGINSWGLAMLIFATACVGNFAFAAAAQGWFAHRNTWYEIPFFLLVTFLMMQPGYASDMLGIDNKYLIYIAGLAVYALIYLNQLRRRVKEEGPVTV